jgi:hypothetical protein
MIQAISRTIPFVVRLARGEVRSGAQPKGVELGAAVRLLNAVIPGSYRTIHKI